MLNALKLFVLSAKSLHQILLNSFKKLAALLSASEELWHGGRWLNAIQTKSNARQELWNIQQQNAKNIAAQNLLYFMIFRYAHSCMRACGE